MEMTEVTMNYGPMLAVLGAAIAAALGGVGSSVGVGLVGQAAAGVAAEKPETAGKLIVLSALPSSQGIYGLIGAFLVMQFFTISELTPEAGWQIFGACMPLAFTAMFSGIYQGKVAAAATNIVAKNPAKSGAGLVLAVMVETFAILGLLITILYLNNIKGALEAVA